MSKSTTNQKLYKKRYFIVFYDLTDEEYIAGFNNIREICEYRGLEPTKENINSLKVGLYNALQRNPSTTSILTGKTNTIVHLIDDKEEDDEINERREQNIMAKFIIINSTINITVDGGIDCIIQPDKDAHGNLITNDSWRTVERWSGLRTSISKGMYGYPIFIKDWESVKSLVDSGLMSFVKEADDCVNLDAATKEYDRLVAYTRQTIKEKEKFAKVVEQPNYHPSVEEPKVEEPKVEVKAEPTDVLANLFGHKEG